MAGILSKQPVPRLHPESRCSSCRAEVSALASWVFAGPPGTETSVVTCDAYYCRDRAVRGQA